MAEAESYMPDCDKTQKAKKFVITSNYLAVKLHGLESNQIYFRRIKRLVTNT